MKHKRPPIPVIVVLVLAIVAAGGYFGIRYLLPQADDTLSASGTIEAVEVTISPEVGGKVLEVLVGEGETVKAGDVLFRLDDTLLQARRTVAAANLDLAGAATETAKAALVTAQANYTLTFNAARAEAAATRTAGWRAPAPEDYTLPGWYFTQAEEVAAARKAVDVAGGNLQTAQAKLETLLDTAGLEGFLEAEERLVEARAAYAVAQDTLDKVTVTNDEALKTAAQNAYEAAQLELQNAQSDYDSWAEIEAVKNILSARAELAVAQESYEVAQDRLLALQTGLYSPRLAAAEAALKQAEAADSQAQAAVIQAEANLALLDVQLSKLTITAPVDGVVLTLSIQPGEVVAPAAAAMNLVRLDDLTITVYVPEDRYGELSLGQAASVSVDSFPGETFKAAITFISDKAEFTPRNVQTVEGRKTTVFAIKLRVDDPEGKLKPGMPADVVFDKMLEH